MYRIEYRDNFLKEHYKNRDDAVKAAIAIAGNADLGDKESLEKMVRTMKEAWGDECDEVN